MSNPRHTFIKITLIGAFLLLFTNACGSGQESSTPSVVPSRAQQVGSHTLTTLNQLASLLIGTTHDQAPRGYPSVLSVEQAIKETDEEAVELSMPCDTGQIAVQGNLNFSDQSTMSSDSVQVTLNGQVPLTQCNGLDGHLNLTGTGDISETDITFFMRLGGTVQTETCVISFDQLVVGLMADTTGQLHSPPIATGLLDAMCGGDQLRCSLTQVTLTDPASLQANCQESYHAAQH